MTKSKHASVIEKEIEEKTLELENLRRELVQARKRLNLRCSHCKESSKVGKITAIQNYSSYDGGYCIGESFRRASWFVRAAISASVIRISISCWFDNTVIGFGAFCPDK
ncbi:MAG: hypothetical protein O3C30_08480 [Proteobacteria bacterium]|nr:hypothetical protein [Pseudomonadota bacterium]